MRKKIQPKPDSSAQTPRETQQSAALHIILGLALFFLAGTLLVRLVRGLAQSGVTLTFLVGLLGVVLFCILGFLLLSGVLRPIFKTIASKRRQNRRGDGHGQL